MATSPSAVRGWDAQWFPLLSHYHWYDFPQMQGPGKPLETRCSLPVGPYNRPTFAAFTAQPDGIWNVYRNTTTLLHSSHHAAREAWHFQVAQSRMRRDSGKKWPKIFACYKMGHVDSKVSSAKLGENNVRVF